MNHCRVADVFRMFRIEGRLLWGATALLTVCASFSVVLFSGVTAEEAEASEVPSGQETERASGTVKGRILYHADPRRWWRYQRYYVKDSEKGELAEAVVALRPLDGQRLKPRPEAETATMDQKNFRFIPETVAIQAGDRVKFLNSDQELHNVKTFHPFHSFNVNMPAGGEHVETFERAGGLRRPYKMGCAFHGSMRAWIFVFDHASFEVTKADGGFELKDIPAGRYELEMVHPAGRLQWSEEIEVEAGETVNRDIDVSPDDLVKKGS